MVKLNEKYYTGDLAKLQEEAILNSLKAESPYPGVWFITVAVNKIEQLDIVDSFAYFSHSNEKRRMEIVGIAYGKREAFNVVKNIADDVYRKQLASDIREYFSDGA